MDGGWGRDEEQRLGFIFIYIHTHTLKKGNIKSYSDGNRVIEWTGSETGLGCLFNTRHLRSYINWKCRDEEKNQR